MSIRLIKKTILIILGISIIIRILGVLNFILAINNSTEIAFNNLTQLNDYIIIILTGILIVIESLKSQNTKPLEIKRIKTSNKIQKNLFLTCLLLLIALGVFTRTYKLGENALRDDELYVNSVAYNFINEGDFYKWDWILDTSGKNTSCISEDPYCNYTRASPYTLLISASYKLLGVSEFSTRLPGAFLGVLSILIIYFLAKYFLENKKLALFPTFLFTLSPLMITWSRYARMYSLLIPLFLLTTYCLYRGLNEKNNVIPKNKQLKTILEKLDFNYKYILIGLLLAFICYQVHIVSLIIFPLLFLYIIIRWLLKKEERDLYLIVLTIVFLIVGILIFNSFFQNISNSKLDLGEVGYRSRYGDFLLSYPLGITLSLAFLSSLLFVSLKKPTKGISQKAVFLAVMIIGALILYLKFIDTALFIDSRYISFLIPFVFIGLTLSIKRISTLINNKKISLLFYSLIAISSIIYFLDFYPQYYTNERVPDLNTALATIRENYEDNELIITNSVRSYYLKSIKTGNIVQMTWRKGYSFKEFKEKVCEYDSGWVYWEEDKIERHIRPEIYFFAEMHFTKIHGLQVDETHVDVYYFQKEDLECLF